jgi:hypothetical protein
VNFCVEIEQGVHAVVPQERTGVIGWSMTNGRPFPLCGSVANSAHVHRGTRRALEKHLEHDIQMGEIDAGERSERERHRIPLGPQAALHGGLAAIVRLVCIFDAYAYTLPVTCRSRRSQSVCEEKSVGLAYTLDQGIVWQNQWLSPARKDRCEQ